MFVVSPFESLGADPYHKVHSSVITARCATRLVLVVHTYFQQIVGAEQLKQMEETRPFVEVRSSVLTRIGGDSEFGSRHHSIWPWQPLGLGWRCLSGLASYLKLLLVNHHHKRSIKDQSAPMGQ